MSAAEKAAILVEVASSPLPKRQVLRDLGVSKSTYYRWLRRQDHQRLDDHPGGGKPAWNRLTLQEVRYVLSAARELPELSCRQLAAWVTDNRGFSVSESTVYRILRREGLVKTPEMRLAAGKEYHRKTTGPHQLWATDASYFRVVGWGYYYLVTVMDDYSRFIPSASSGQALLTSYNGT
jgi:putative transposase